jgi:hypothetical protein
VSRGRKLRRTFNRFLAHIQPSIFHQEGSVEILFELTEDQLQEVSGGSGTASFSFTNTASGTTAAVSGTLAISTTASSASLSGTFSSSST